MTDRNYYTSGGPRGRKHEDRWGERGEQDDRRAGEESEGNFGGRFGESRDYDPESGRQQSPRYGGESGESRYGQSGGRSGGQDRNRGWGESGRGGGGSGQYGSGQHDSAPYGSGQSNYGTPSYGRAASSSGTSNYGRSDYGYSGGRQGSQSGDPWRGYGGGRGESQGGFDGPSGWFEPHGESQQYRGSQSAGSQSGGLHRGKGPKGYQRTDDRLKELICERLHEDPEIDPSDVTVTVSGSRVTLDGTVDSRRTKNAIEDIVEQFQASDVQNNLRVSRQSAGSPSGVSQGEWGQSAGAMSGVGGNDDNPSATRQKKN